MIFAETIQFTPEEQAALLLIGAVILAAFLAAVVLGVAGIVSGFRYGRDAARTGARTVWITALVLESLLVVLLVGGSGLGISLPFVLATALTVAAWWLGTAFPVDDAATRRRSSSDRAAPGSR